MARELSPVDKSLAGESLAAQRKLYTLSCEYCNAEMLNVTIRKKYCSTKCRMAAKRKRDREE